MSKNIEECLQEAIFLENRGFKKEAKKYYDLLKINIQLLDIEGLTRISKFYHSQKEYDIVFEASKLAIETSGSIQVLAPLFITSWEKLRGDISYLEWLLTQPGIEYVTEIQLYIARYLFFEGKKDKAYMISLEIADRMDREFRRNSTEYKLYIDTVLNLVEIEFLYKNYTQARFHLRKLIYLNNERLSREQDIVYWAIVLDEISNFVTREEWAIIDSKITGDVKFIGHFYKELSQNVLTKNTVEQLQNNCFADEALEKKRNSYIRLIKRMSSHPNWYDGIEQDRLKSPNDLLTTLLYGNYLKSNLPQNLRNFWKLEFPKHADRTEAIKAYWNASKQLSNTETKLDLKDCHVTFLGGGQKIGGTSILISIKGNNLLLDAGMHLNEDPYHPDYSPMFEKGITFDDVDALLISHAHMDHTGAVPFVHKLNPNLPMYATEATTSLMKLLLTDTVRIAQESNINMYSEEDVQRALFSIKTIDFYQTFQIQTQNDTWKITYYPSGHILGAGAIHIELKGISILFTGDYSVDDQKTVKGMNLPESLKVDILITESTYGFLPTNASVARPRQEHLFLESVKRTMDKAGSMLIPSFAVGRAQEIILILREAFREEKYLPFNLFLDGRVTDVCQVYQRYAEKHQYINPTYYQNEDEEQIFLGGGVQAAQYIYSNRRGSNFTFNNFIEDFISPGNNCIVASSGMLTDYSASARYAEYLIEEERNAISFTGYMDEESPGQHILQTSKIEDESSVKVNGSDKVVRARIESFRLSAHASREQILQLIVDLQPKKVFLMHGEHEKRFEPIQTIVKGEKIYPSLIELLSNLKEEIEVIPAFNGRRYNLYKN
ncbi:MBL fold metallo-hydrolase [Sutcliffiella deserti]|uniref:MBL fold metallo-hydrolase n=1 Tax=Sutcliffiella deserti TaxID=2875501 RepID=UPI001CBF3310|nr:MBL fold metallo-hydrolase [Sutcliffiella deserti]